MCVFFRFILGAVSPAVVVPSMLILQKNGYGVSEGIPTLIMAASSCDDVLAISMFSIFLGVAFSEGHKFCYFKFDCLSKIIKNNKLNGYIFFLILFF